MSIFHNPFLQGQQSPDRPKTVTEMKCCKDYGQYKEISEAVFTSQPEGE